MQVNYLPPNGRVGGSTEGEFEVATSASTSTCSRKFDNSTAGMAQHYSKQQPNRAGLPIMGLDRLHSTRRMQSFRNNKKLPQLCATDDCLGTPANSTATATSKATPKRSLSADDYCHSLHGSGKYDKPNDMKLGIPKEGGDGGHHRGVKLELSMSDNTHEDKNELHDKKKMSRASSTRSFRMDNQSGHHVRASKGGKMTLDELIASYHEKDNKHHRKHAPHGNPHLPSSNKRRHLRHTANGMRDRWALRKSLSYGQIQDLAFTVHSAEFDDIKASLHGIHQQLKETPSPDSKEIAMEEASYKKNSKDDVLLNPTNLKEVAKKVAGMFVGFLFPPAELEAASQELLFSDQVRELILELDLAKMEKLMQHMEHCQIAKNPVDWEWLAQVMDPNERLDWHAILLAKHLRSSHHNKTLHNMLNNNNNQSDLHASFSEFTYYSEYDEIPAAYHEAEEIVEYELTESSEYEEIIEYASDSDCSTSFLRSDDGEGTGNFFNTSDDDDDSLMSGFSLEAFTEHCGSSITIEEWGSLVGSDLDDEVSSADEHTGDVMIEVVGQCDTMMVVGNDEQENDPQCTDTMGIHHEKKEQDALETDSINVEEDAGTCEEEGRQDVTVKVSEQVELKDAIKDKSEDTVSYDDGMDDADYCQSHMIGTVDDKDRAVAPEGLLYWEEKDELKFDQVVAMEEATAGEVETAKHNDEDQEEFREESTKHDIILHNENGKANGCADESREQESSAKQKPPREAQLIAKRVAGSKKGNKGVGNRIRNASKREHILASGKSSQEPDARLAVLSEVDRTKPVLPITIDKPAKGVAALIAMFEKGCHSNNTT